MKSEDHRRFAELWCQTYTAITYREMPLDHVSINVAFKLLSPYPIEQIDQLLTDVVRSNRDGFMPPVGALLERLGENTKRPESLTDDELLDLAYARTTPIGCYVYCLLSDHTMNHLPRPVQINHVKHYRRQIGLFIENYSANQLDRTQLQYLKAYGFDGSLPLLSTQHQPPAKERAQIHYDNTGPMPEKLKTLIAKTHKPMVES